MQSSGMDSSRQVALSAPPVGMLEGRRAFDHLIARWPDTDAVMCVSDPCAFGALSSCQLRGWSVPKRMAIAGFGAFEISASSVPSITTISVSGLEIGRITGEMLLELLYGGAPLKTKLIEIPTALLIRQSS